MPRILKKKVVKKEEAEVVLPQAETPQAEEVKVVEKAGCQNCNGTGKQNAEDLCVICQGSGCSLL